MPFKSNGCASWKERTAIAENQQDLANYSGGDLAMEKRLLVDDAKIDGMILSLKQLASRRSNRQVLLILPTTTAWKSVIKQLLWDYFNHLWIRPDVTVEAGGIAFKSGNKILLKGGKESLLSNLKIVSLWHQALTDNVILLLSIWIITELKPKLLENQRKK
jgi:glutamate-5-semialdehyde dehydrogenase